MYTSIKAYPRIVCIIKKQIVIAKAEYVQNPTIRQKFVPYFPGKDGRVFSLVLFYFVYNTRRGHLGFAASYCTTSEVHHGIVVVT